ncbi:MAG: YceD family protein [Propionibacteriaceae bacterium]|jgi:uncharacterized protein|nr:YceD family protein [Propionibacteriaceae bacterium]
MDGVISLRDLRRTEGATKEFALSEPVGDALEVGLVHIPSDRVVEAQGVLEAVGDGVWVDGEASAEVDAQCSRCLTDFSYTTQAEIKELFVYEDFAEQYADEDVSFVKDDAIDLEPAIRDCLILDQPLVTLCRPDCQGLCPECGANLNDEPEHSHPDTTDSRWSGLASWGSMS